MIVWYTLDIYNYTCQLFLNKVEGKKRTMYSVGFASRICGLSKNSGFTKCIKS